MNKFFENFFNKDNKKVLIPAIIGGIAGVSILTHFVLRKKSKKSKIFTKTQQSLNDLHSFHKKWNPYHNGNITLTEKIEIAKKAIRKYLTEGFVPEVGLVLGSGLNVLADEIENPVAIPFSKIPYFPTSTFDTQKKCYCVLGELGGRKVITMKYRCHYYEGYSMEQITFPIRVMSALGIKNLLLTNACGAVDKKYNVGDFMLLTDHINFSGDNPLIGYNYEELGKRFIDCCTIYDPEINENILNKVKELNKEIKEKDKKIVLQKGVYWMNSGPSYETPAEVRLARICGGSVVGMSTVPEALIARHEEIKISAISLVCNMGAGILSTPLDHTDVMEASTKAKPKFINLVKSILPLMVNTKKEEDNEE